MESGKIKNGLNKGFWRVMESNIRDVSEVPTMKSLDAPKAPVKSKKEKVTEDDDDLKVASDQELYDFINKNV